MEWKQKEEKEGELQNFIARDGSGGTEMFIRLSSAQHYRSIGAHFLELVLWWSSGFGFWDQAVWESAIPL